MRTLKAFLILALTCGSVFGAEPDIRVISTTQTNAETGSAYAKDVFTRAGQTNLIRITKVNPQGTARIHRFYHDGRLVGNVVAFPEESTFNTEPGPYCMSSKYAASGEIVSARIGNREGVLLDEFRCTHGILSPVDGPLRQNGLMKPKFGSETEFLNRKGN